MKTRLIGLLVKEMLQFLRDRVMLILILWLYTIEVVICTLALSFEVKDMPLAVVDLDKSPASRSLIQEFVTSEAFTPSGNPVSATEAARWLRTGRTSVAVIIPERFQRALVRGESPKIQILVDGTNSNVAAQARGYGLEIVNRFLTAQFPHRRNPAGGAIPMIRVWYNQDQTYTSFMVLSMVALAALMVGVIHPAASIVREKESGTIEQLRITPIGTLELFIAKTLPTFFMGLVSVFPSLLIVWWFDVPLRGSLALFLFLTALFLFSAISLGVLIATVCRTLQQALLLSFFGLFPLMFLSGTLAPVESMPRFLQDVSLISPLRHYLDVILGIFLKGSGMPELWPQALALAAIGLPLFGLATWVYRRSA